MIRHIVLFRMKPEVSKEDKDELIKDLKALKEKIPVVKELEIGLDISRKPNCYDIALNSVFENREDLDAYAIHPEHIKVVNKIKKLCQPAVKVDFNLP